MWSIIYSPDTIDAKNNIDNSIVWKLIGNNVLVGSRTSRGGGFSHMTNIRRRVIMCSCRVGFGMVIWWFSDRIGIRRSRSRRKLVGNICLRRYVIVRLCSWCGWSWRSGMRLGGSGMIRWFGGGGMGGGGRGWRRVWRWWWWLYCRNCSSEGRCKCELEHSHA